jgi:hypothetical protein
MIVIVLGFIYNFCYRCSKRFCMILDKNHLAIFCALWSFIDGKQQQIAAVHRLVACFLLLALHTATRKHSCCRPPVFSQLLLPALHNVAHQETSSMAGGVAAWPRCLHAQRTGPPSPFLLCHDCPPSVGCAAARLPRLSRCRDPERHDMREHRGEQRARTSSRHSSGLL